MKDTNKIIRFDRVRAHDAARRRAAIDRETGKTVEAISSAGRPAIQRRINTLDREWDLERYLELTAATLSLIGIAFAIRYRKALILPAVVLGFLAQHALHGWCPPVPVFRSFGVRTRKEIDAEKFRLLELLGLGGGRRSPAR